MYIAIILIQLLVSVVVGLYFLRAMRRERQGAAASTPESLREMDKMRKLREIRLNLPLGEQVRPKRFADIIVPEGGKNPVALEMIIQRVRSHVEGAS